MTGVTIQVKPSADVPLAEAKAIEVAEAEAEALEEISSDAVTIAAIEADKEIALAAINADTRLAEAEIYAEASAPTAQENDVWTILNQLSLQVAGLSEQVTLLTQAEATGQESLSSLVEAELTEAEMLTAPENDLTPSDTLPLTDSTQMEHIAESAEESPAIPPILEVGGKPIIRLI